MTDTPLAKKLGIKAGYKLLILDAPPGYQELLGALPDRTETFTTAQVSITYDFVQLFVRSVAELEAQARVAIDAVKPNGLLWISYPKKSGKIKTDISRDMGWEAVRKAGWDGVTLVSIDETWSALRFRPLADIKSRDGVSRIERMEARKKQDKG
jgi:hypothetical protein